MEILITLVIVLAAAYILYSNIKKSSKGDCNCGDCHSKCAKYNDKIMIKK